MGIIKDKNYVAIQGWMVNNLKLTGNDLIIYAIIYGFTQDEEQWFEGSRSYLSGWCNSTKRGIQKNLNRLVEIQLILKKEVFINNVKFCKYKANPKFTPGGSEFTSREQSSPGGREQSSPGGREQSSPNNIDIDNIDTNNIDKYIYDHSEKIRNDRVSGSQVNKEFEDEIKHDEVDNGIVVSNFVNKEQKNIVTAKQLRDDFEAIWALYPRKQGKKVAFAAYCRAIKQGTSHMYIMAGVQNYTEYIKARKVSQEYIKQGSTFFSQNSWEDDWNIGNNRRTAVYDEDDEPFDVDEYVKQIREEERAYNERQKMIKEKRNEF